MVSEVLGVNTKMKIKGFNVCVNRVEKVLPQSSQLILIEMIPFNEITFSRVEDLNVHFVASRILALASLRSAKVALPSESSLSLSFRI